MLSASQAVEPILHAKSLGVLAYISKPLNGAKWRRFVQEFGRKLEAPP